MKKLLILSAMILLCSLPAISANTPEVKYEVTITITYNALSVDEASKVISKAMDEHRTACKVGVTSKKVSNNTAALGSANLIYNNLTDAWELN